MTTPIAHQPGAMSVELFHPGQFITPHGWTHDRDGNCSPVLHARFDGADGAFDGYAKPFDWNDKAQATMVLNEVTGWLLAHASRLPCPQRAFFIQLPLAKLPPYTGPEPLPPADANGHVLCFVSQAAANTAIRGLYPTQLLLQEQIAWPRCNDTIAFDEGLGNADRHLFNLVRRGPGDFVLIDHGYLLRDPDAPYPAHWGAGAIEAMPPRAFDNLLHHNAYRVSNRNAPGVCMDGCAHGMQFGGALRAALQQSMFEISFWCSRLLPGTSARWLRFLYDRAQHAQLSDLLHKRYGLIPLQ